MSFRAGRRNQDEALVRLEKPSMGNSKLVIYCSAEDLKREQEHLRCGIGVVN
jgi:hypothetical protein